MCWHNEEMRNEGKRGSKCFRRLRHVLQCHEKKKGTSGSRVELVNAELLEGKARLS